jgi:hypothetical protein
MSIGQGNISYSAPPAKATGGIAVTGARNGLSVDSAGYIVLGENVGAAGSPGKFLSAREEDMQGFYIIWQNGRMIISNDAVADNGAQLQIHNSAYGAASSPMLQMTVDAVSGANFSGLLAINVTDGGDLGYELISATVDGNQTFLLSPNGSAEFSDNVTGDNFAAIQNSILSTPIAGNISTFGASAFLTMASGTGDYSDYISNSAIFDSGGSTLYTGFAWKPQLGRSGTGITRGIYLAPSISSLAGKFIGFENQTGDVYLCSALASPGGGVGRVGVHGITAPTAWFHLGAGAAAASSAAMKFQSGTLQTVAEAGAVEYNGTNWFVTPGSAVRATMLASIAVSASVSAIVTNKVEVNIGGTLYYLLASTSST